MSLDLFPMHSSVLLCRYVASKLTFKLLQDTIHAKSVETLRQFAKRQKNVAISPAGKAKIRYVGSMCVAKA